jgi:hypothetical protein
MAGLLVDWWVTLCDTVTRGYLSRCLRPDDRLFVAMLAAWVVLDGLVSCALLGWAGVGVILFAGALLSMLAIAMQSSEGSRPGRAAERP